MRPVRPATIRRLLVVGVCACGVGCLYLAPSVARSPDQASSRVSDNRPISRPSTTAKPVSIQSTGRAIPDARAETSQDPEPADSTDDATSSPQRQPKPKHQQPQPRPGSSGATAFDPKENARDRTPPDPVGGIRFGPVTQTRVTVHWEPAHDDTEVVGYRLWLDGFPVATTADTEVTVKWFNDDTGQHVIQLKALDAAGNLSKTAQSVLVTRPTPSPTPEPSAEPTDSASEAPTDAGKGKPGGKPSEQPHESNVLNGDG